MKTLTGKITRLKLVLAIAGALLAVLSIAARPAAADAPVITTQVIRVTTPVPFEISCPSFAMLTTSTAELTNITFYENGSPVRLIRHVNFEGTLYNANTSYSVPFDGDFTRTQDYLENTVTFTGKRWRVHIPGEGVLALNVGRTVFDFSVNPPQIIFEAGQHEFREQICQVLDH